jgi:hypothetical protein
MLAGCGPRAAEPEPDRLGATEARAIELVDAVEAEVLVRAALARVDAVGSGLPRPALSSSLTPSKPKWPKC